MREQTGEVKCRPGAAIWGGVIMLLLFAALFIAAPRWAANSRGDCGCSNQSPRDAAQTLAFFTGVGIVVCLVPALLCIVYAVRARIIADRAGLRWHGLWLWKSVGWDEVYSLKESSRPGSSLCTVKTSAGRLVFSESGFTNARALRETIETHLSSMEGNGFRDGNGEFPILLRYHAFPIGMSLLLFVVNCCCVVPGLLWSISGLAETARVMGWGWGIAIYAFPFLIVGICCLGVVMFGSWLAEAWRGRHKLLSVYGDGITFEDTERLVEASWSDLEEVYYDRSRRFFKGGWNMVFVTRCGAFELNFALCLFPSYTEFMQILKHNAPEAIQRGEQRFPTIPEQLDTKETAAPGEQVFSYRTRSTRAVLWIPSTMGVALICVPTLRNALYAHYGIPPLPNYPWMTLIGIGFLGAAFLAWLSYRRCKIVVNSEGITQARTFKTRSLRWQEVVSCHRDYGDYCVSGKTTRITFSPGITSLDKLKSEIALRIPESVKPFQE